MAIINYAIQSELNIYLLSALQIKVERREHKSVDAAIKVSSCIGLHCNLKPHLYTGYKYCKFLP